MKRDYTIPTIVAIVMTWIWVHFAGIYDYKWNDMIVFGVNLFPFICWIIGLLIFKMVYDTVRIRQHKFIIMWIGYIVGLLILEYVGYHMLNIQLASNYPGLLGMDILHTPVFAKVYYLTAGPIFIGINKIIEG